MGLDHQRFQEAQKLLGVEVPKLTGATSAETLKVWQEGDLRAAWKSAARIWHPDRHPEDEKAEAEATFKKLKSAYEYLRNLRAVVKPRPAPAPVPMPPRPIPFVVPNFPPFIPPSRSPLEELILAWAQIIATRERSQKPQRSLPQLPALPQPNLPTLPPRSKDLPDLRGRGIPEHPPTPQAPAQATPQAPPQARTPRTPYVREAEGRRFVVIGRRRG